MVSFRVRATSLGEVAANLQTVVAVFDAACNQANSSVRGVVNASWQGEDADNFDQQWTQWNATALTVRTSLVALAAQLTAAEGSYTTTESGLGSGFIQRRQANQASVDASERVSDSVEEGQDRADASESRRLAGAGGGFATVAKGGGSGQGESRDQQTAFVAQMQTTKGQGTAQGVAAAKPQTGSDGQGS
jgi:WXG100 family type VII secretion target